MTNAGFRQRLAAILAADVVGYSRLMANDEHGTVVALETARLLFKAAIESHHGRVLDMVGDSVLAFFESASGAVEAALTVQENLASSALMRDDNQAMRFRVGIHLGDLIEKADGTVYGDGVNVAARLEGLAEPGGVTISDAVYIAVRNKVKAEFIDRGEQTVKNIAHPLRHYHVTAKRDLTDTFPDLVGGAVSASLQVRSPLSIVVLPFVNLSGDSEYEYLADGITADLTTDLGRISGSFVIARTSAFTYKGKAIDARQVGRELGVRYVLEGSVRHAGNRVRVNVQLIESESGAHLWTDRLDRELVDVLDLADDVTGGIARVLRYELIDAESRRSLRERPRHPQAIDYVLREAALWQRDSSPTQETIAECKRLLECALEFDPAMLPALTGLAQLKVNEMNTQRIADSAVVLGEIEDLVARAETVAPNDARVLQVRANTFILRREPERALPVLQSALRRDPNSTSLLRNLGWCTLFLGDPERAIEHLERSLQLDPRGKGRGSVYGTTGVANLYLGRYDDAIRLLGLCTAELPDLAFARYALAAAYALAGRTDDARAALDAFRRLRPGVGLTQLRRETLSGNVKYLALRERLYAGLELAGLENDPGQT